MRYFSRGALGLIVLGLLLLATNPVSMPKSFFNEAEAWIGRPLTPLSFAGVARRTARRSIWAAGAYTAAAATTAAALYQPVTVVNQQPVTVIQQQDKLPVGSTLPSLPAGCDSTTVNSRSYFTCGDNWYKPAMQNGNIVYSVVANPNY